MPLIRKGDIILEEDMRKTDRKLMTVGVRPTSLGCLKTERLLSKRVGYNWFYQSQFIDILLKEKYTIFDPNMKKYNEQIGCDISYG